MNKCTLKELIDELTLIYNKYGDIGVCKDDECGGLLYIYIYIYILNLLESQTTLIKKVILLNM